MAQSLKDEREEIVVRCHLAKGDADRAVAETAGHANPGKYTSNCACACACDRRIIGEMTEANGADWSGILH